MRKKVLLLLVVAMAILVPIAVLAATNEGIVPPAQEFVTPPLPEGFSQEYFESGIIPPAREVSSQENFSVDSDVANIAPFAHYVDVVFVCNVRNCTGSPPRDLVITTPGNFTVPGRGTMTGGTQAIFQGWVSPSGVLWEPGVRIGWDVAWSGTYTMTASWVWWARDYDCEYGCE